MNIFFPDIHIYLTQSMAASFKKMGHTLILPSNKYKPCRYPKWHNPATAKVWNEYWTQEKAEKEIGSNVLCLSKSEILDLKPEILFISSLESQEEVLLELYPRLTSSKLIAYSGNDYWEGAYDLSTIDNYLCADMTGHRLSIKYGKNHLYYRPEINYDLFKYQGVSDGNIFGSYINHYQSAFPKEYAFCNKLTNSIPGMKYAPSDQVGREQMVENLKNSIGTIHIKSLEGYGFSIIESMASGRPVFLNRDLSQNKSLLNWSVEGETAFFFSDPFEFKNKVLAFIEDEDFRHKTQEACARSIRNMVNNEEQFTKLENFINNIPERKTKFKKNKHTHLEDLISIAREKNLDPADMVRLNNFKYIDERFPVESLFIYNSPFSKSRLGKRGDGGYVIAEGLKYDCLIGCGINDDISFEQAFLDIQEVPAFAFDGTIEELPEKEERLTFSKKNISDISSKTEENLHELISRYHDIFLKIDIEGDEYIWLNTLNADLMSRFKQITIEFHEPYEKYKWKCLQELSKTHYAIHFNPNNSSSLCELKGNVMPENFELTYLRKSEFRTIPLRNEGVFPTHIDFPNDPSRPITVFSSEPFRITTK